MPGTIDTVRTVRDLRTRVAAWRASGETVALVPTMGAIHAGHLSLVTLAKTLADHVVTSLFVNPLQFGPREDFHAYPRSEARDTEALAKAGSELLYAPDANEMYPPGFSTKVHVGDLTEDLCGASRPNHFDGVATVVAKLLLQCAPDKAIFGEKDYQQLLVIKRFVRDLNIPVEIAGGPIVREADGLALSSRNAYLSPAERTVAPVLHATIAQVAGDLAKGRGADDASEAARFKLEADGLALSSRNAYLSPAERAVAPVLHATIAQVAGDLAKGRGADDASEAARFKLEAAGFRVDYVAVRDPDTLKPLHGPVKRARVLAAVHLGKTRLIDNVPVLAES